MMSWKNFLCLPVLYMTIIPSCDAARILGIVPMASKSHHIITLSLFRELAKQHEMTVINFYPQEKPIPNYTDIALTMDMFQGSHGGNMFTDMPTSTVETFLFVWMFGNILTDGILQSPNVQELIQSKEQKFDLIILETLFNEALVGFAHRFKAPIIQLCPYIGSHWMHNTVGNPSPFSHVPDPFLNYGDHMTFIERLHNTLVGLYGLLGRELYYLPKQDAIMRKYFNNSGPLPYIRDLEQQTSLLLVNSHVSLSYPRPMVPNAIQVGGMHIKPPKKLPKDLQEYLDDAPNGVIYFSMGSNLKSSEMPDEKKKALIEVFSKLKQKIMWKWETEKLPGQPPNLMIRNWFPQPDVLAHPNIKLFITHGGLLSTTEAIYHGVPLLGIPVYGDQELNIQRAESMGYGIKLNFGNVSSLSLEWALNTILNDPRYQENAKKLSRVFKDQPEHPMDRAVYWVEYVLRHKGAPHLRSAALDLYWYQYFLLDVIAVILVAIVISIISMYIVIKTVVKLLARMLWKTKTTSNKKKKS